MQRQCIFPMLLHTWTPSKFSSALRHLCAQSVRRCIVASLQFGTRAVVISRQRLSALLTLAYIPQMPYLSKTEDAVRRRETHLLDVRQEWPPVPRIPRSE
jgi:hypothetical protein